MKILAKSASAAIAGLALSILLIPVRAEPPKIDFDQGVNPSQVLEDIRRQQPINPIDKTVLIPPLDALTAPDFSLTGPVSGVNLTERIQQSEPYETALQYPR